MLFRSLNHAYRFLVPSIASGETSYSIAAFSAEQALRFIRLPLLHSTSTHPRQGDTFIASRKTGMSKQKENSPIPYQISLIEEAMKHAGVWRKRTPDWVYTYQGEAAPDIWEWLQFIYLPMREKGEACPPHLLAPLLATHLDTKTDLGHVLKLVIELDSISSTIEKNNTL